MVPGWVPFKIVSDSPAFHSRWPLLLKIEISSNGQNCSILSQNVPKFELCKHNDELFSIYYRIFYELWTFADFDRLYKLEKRGDEILKKNLLWNYWANLNQTLLKWFLGGPSSKIVSGTSSSIKTKLWWNGHWMVLFQNCVRQLRSPTKMATTVQLRCYWKQLWSRWAITGSWKPLVVYAWRQWSNVKQEAVLQLKENTI